MNKRVLIVEDEGIVSLEIEETLQRLGHSVVGTVDTGKAAVAVARKTHPDLILMDVSLSGDMDGVEAAETIHKEADIPVVYLTAYSSDEVLRRAMVTDPYAYLIKPVQEQQLAGALQTAWHRHDKDIAQDRNIERFASILKALPHGIVAVDGEGKVRYLNSHARKLVGLTTRESWGRPIREVVILDDADAAQILETQIIEIATTREPISLGKHTLRSHLDETATVGVDISTFENRNGLPLGALLILSEPSIRSETSLAGTAALSDAATAKFYPPATEMGQVRSFVEIEIIRLALSDPMADLYERGRVDGQIAGYKQCLQSFFGEDAVAEIEAIVPDGTPLPDFH